METHDDMKFEAARRFEGLLIGTAVADSLGLPREGLSRTKARKMFGAAPLKQALVVLPGMRMGLCSDDTEHAWLTAQALIASPYAEEKAFTKKLASKLRWWFLRMPAGIGKATLKSCLNLCLGVSPAKSGVKSAGNGPAMRAPVIGAFYANNPMAMARILKASSWMTHRSVRAYEGSWVIAKAAALMYTQAPEQAPIMHFFNQVLPQIKGSELRDRLMLAQNYLRSGKTLSDYLKALSLLRKGVSGYINDTVPVVIYTWLSCYGSYEEALTQVIEAGGDTDSTAALVGALLGMGQGVQAIPSKWLRDLREWPAGKSFLQQMAQALAIKQQQPQAQVKAPKCFGLLLWVRNLFFFIVVLLHGFRRLLPF